MFIRVIKPIPGLTEGRALHTVGAEVELTDALAVSLLNDGFVKPVDVVIETASVKPSETASTPSARRGRKPS